MEKRLFTQYCAKDMLHDAMLLSADAELAYRRLYDLLVVTGGELPDSDRDLAERTRLGMKRWLKAKTELFSGDDPLMCAENGTIFCPEVLLKLESSNAFSSEQSRKAKLGVEKRNALKSKKTRSAVATAPAPAGGSAEPPAETQPTDNRKLSKKESPIPPKPEDRFLDWYAAYPRKVGRDAARVAFGRALKRGATPDLLIAAARAYAESRKAEDPKFTKHPTTWLNGGHWADEDVAIAEPDETPEQRMTNFYRHWLKTGKWLDDNNPIDAIPITLKNRLDAEFDREQIEANGQQQLALAPAVPPPV